MESNVQKLIDALRDIIALCSKRDYPVEELVEIERVAENALSAQPRNCDVGTAEEQKNRFREFCRLYKYWGMCGQDGLHYRCPAFHGSYNPDCSLWWAQMPYVAEQKGEGNGSK